MVFPAFSEMHNKTNDRFAVASFLSIVIYTVAVVGTVLIAILLFGKNLKPDLLENIARRAGGLSVFIRLVYCLLLLFHLPFIFFTVKEYTLVMYDEFFNRSLSIHLEEKLADQKQKQ